MEKDVSAIEDMEKWLTSLPKNKPFFAFLFLDSVHSAIFPETEEFTVFKPYWKEVNQIKLSNDFDRTPISTDTRTPCTSRIKILLVPLIS